MIHSFPIPCPKCSHTNDADTPVCHGCPQKAGDYSICLKCGAVSKLNEFGILEEASEFEFGMLDEDVKELVSKVREGIKSGSMSFDLSYKGITQIGEAFGHSLANRMADLRNQMAQASIIPPQALDNVLVQAMVYELAASVVSMLRITGDLTSKPAVNFVNELRGAFNLVIRKFTELHARNVNIVSIDIDELEKEEDGKEHESH